MTELLAPADHGPVEHVAGLDALVPAEVLLEVDEDLRHHPVDAVPRLGDISGDDIGAQHPDDRSEQVVVDDLSDPEGGVLVADAREEIARVRLGGRMMRLRTW
ncbi:hypothetical protein [Helcobacillus massiliensis]|uniref:Uncharacterized protein n=1 Tax=Helcobacillus massiliensis TaxID=521392 RepID=A0A839QR77_9MICO|nr:hypothetical protein [Helcobacillus massiliensis]MBB3022814.1 hypothetical protein [Helcobacillus massiliensis]